MAARTITVGLPDGAVVPVGTATDGYVIASDSGTPTWTAAAGGGGSPQVPLEGSQRTMGGPFGESAATSAAFIANRCYAFLFDLPRDGTLDEMALHIIGAVASSTYRLGLYLPDDTNDFPGTLIVAHAGTLSGASTGEQSVAISQAVTAGTVWAVVQTGSTAGATSRSYAVDERRSLGRASGDVQARKQLVATRSDAALPADLSGTSWSYDSGSNIPHGLMVAYA